MLLDMRLRFTEIVPVLVDCTCFVHVDHDVSNTSDMGLLPVSPDESHGTECELKSVIPVGSVVTSGHVCK